MPKGSTDLRGSGRLNAVPELFEVRPPVPEGHLRLGWGLSPYVAVGVRFGPFAGQSPDKGLGYINIYIYIYYIYILYILYIIYYIYIYIIYIYIYTGCRLPLFSSYCCQLMGY